MKIFSSFFSLVTGFVLLANTLLAQQTFNTVQPATMQRELGIIKQAFTALHPGIYRYQTPKQVDAMFSSYADLFSYPQPENKYFIRLSQLTTRIQCGHTYLNPWNQPKTVRGTLFSKSFMPLLFKVIDRKIIVTHNLSANTLIKPGDELQSINGTPANLLIDSLLTVSRSDGQNGLDKKLNNINIDPLDVDTANYTLFDTFLPLFFPANFNAPKYSLRVKPFRGKAITVNLPAFTKQQRAMAYVNKFGAIPVHEKNWTLKLSGKSTACLAIGDFETWEWKSDYKKFLDSVFTVLQQKKVQNLIVDIRGNEGGDDEAREQVLSYLIKKPFGCDNPMRRLYRFLTIPDSLSPYLTTWNEGFKTPKNAVNFIKTPDGLYESKTDINTPCIPVVPKAKVFKGKIFLITDAKNSSTSFTLADVFHRANAGTIVGEPTGGNKQGINGGQFFFLNLPITNLEIDIPLIWGASPIKRAEGGLKPDIFIKTTQADIYYHRDAQLNYILTHIRQ